MNQRKLAVLIGIAVGTASSAGLAQTDTTDRVVADPPPAAAQSIRGQTMTPDRLDRDLDDPRPVVEGDLGEAYEDEFAYEESEATAERDVIDEDISDDNITDEDLIASEAAPMRGVHDAELMDEDGVVETQSPHNDPTLADRVTADDDFDDGLADAERSREDAVVFSADDDVVGDDVDADLDARMGADRTADVDAVDEDVEPVDAVVYTAEDDTAIDSRDQDPNDYASQPLGVDEFDQTRAQTRAEIVEEQRRPVAEVDEGGRTAVVVQYPAGTPFSQEAGTGGFENAAPVTQQTFQELDDDQSGALEPTEIPETMTLEERFADYDINGDGVIAKNEFQSYFAAQSWLEGEQDLPRRDAEIVAGDDDTGLDVDVVEVDPDTEE